MNETLGLLLVVLTSALIGGVCGFYLGYWGLLISAPIAFSLGVTYGLSRDF